MNERGEGENFRACLQDLYLATDLLGDGERLCEWQMCCGEILFLRLREKEIGREEEIEEGEEKEKEVGR